jgi:hypothetical protein
MEAEKTIRPEPMICLPPNLEKRIFEWVADTDLSSPKKIMKVREWLRSKKSPDASSSRYASKNINKDYYAVVSLTPGESR